MLISIENSFVTNLISRVQIKFNYSALLKSHAEKNFGVISITA